MNKHKFIELVENPSSIREKDADILTDLARNYPYSSLVHTMLAKARQDTPEAKKSLSTAALYIPDRRVLKAVMEGSLDNKASGQGPEAGHSAPSSTGRLADEAQQAAKAPVNVIDETQENLRVQRKEGDRYDNPARKRDSLPPEQTKKASSPANIPVKHLPERLQEILENKEELQINDPKRLEQINMIDSFLQNSSNIARKYRSLGEESQEQSDMSSTYQFTPPDLVTENLAQIMERQGKTEKAIDIYEKLVLKYPQKKAYFATCIEKLKTSL